MCGIAGILLKSGAVQPELLKQMTEAIKHRGPDGDGHWVNDKANIGLGHRRLSIIDLSEKAAQPMHYANNRYTISFNGEIYNYIELREELIKYGYSFFSNSDTEVLLAIYDQLKEKCLPKLDGMFSFAIWDEQEQTLFCARDRFGEKPFYYKHLPGEAFYFASEMKALWAIGVSKEISPDKIGHYLQSGELLDAADLSSTFYKGISQLDGAHYMIIKNLNEIKQENYYNLDNIEPDKRLSVKDASDRLFNLLEKSVRLRLRSDVPVGSSLSGGLDSSSIVKLIEQLKPADYFQTTFSARFDNYDKDEGAHIKEIVSSVKQINAYEVWPSGENMMNAMDKMYHHQEEPYGSGSIFAQWEVMKLAKEKNVTVLLDGQGADEYLCGYTPYYNMYLDQLYFNRRGKYRSELKAFNQNKTGEKVIPRLNSLRGQLSYIKQKALGGNAFYPKDYLELQLKKDVLTTGLKVLLRYADRNSMAHSREIRLPFLDHKIVDFVFSLPDSYKLKNGFTKWILRKSTEHILPPSIAWRTDKVGYEVPQNVWLSEAIDDKVQKDVHQYLADHNIQQDTLSMWNYYMINKLAQ